MDNRVSFLIGSGLSKAMGKPSTLDITNEIRAEDCIQKTMRIEWYKDPNSDSITLKQKPFPIQILDFINKLFEIAEKNNTHEFYKLMNQKTKRHIVNYEDISYFLTQIYEHFAGNFNPYGKILSELVCFQDLVDQWSPQGPDRPKEKLFIRRAIQYIDYTVFRMLKGPVDNLKIIDDVFHNVINSKGKTTNIFTLNHDIVIEDFLHTAGISYIDGFGEIDGDLRKWNPTVFDNTTDYTLRLLKLHGSIDWRRFNAKDGTHSIHAIYVGALDIDYQYSEVFDNEETCYRIPRSPDILIGTANKIKSYMERHYWELHSLFRHYLRETDLLIVIGYSFGDSGINSQLLEWLGNENKKMIVIDKKELSIFVEELPYPLRSGKFRRDFLNSRKIKYYPEGVEKVDFSELQK